jgi:hypothetical protein
MGGSLRSSTMTHLSRLPALTRAQVTFILETRNSTLSRVSILNHFNLSDAFVPSQGRSGGLWLMWSDDVAVTIVDSTHHYIFAICVNKSSLKQYSLVCVYGDPHHRATSEIWDQVLDFVVSNPSLLCSVWETLMSLCMSMRS